MNSELNTIPAPATQGPMAIIQAAISSGASPDILRQMLDVQMRWEADQARKAYAEAMIGLKQENLSIQHDRTVTFPGTAYTHASIGKVCDVLTAAAAKHGFSHSWKTEQQNGTIAVTCVLTHRAGHSESVRMEAPPDDSGKKNKIQQIASTITYLERYTLLAAIGASTTIDDDGRSAGRDSTHELLDDLIQQATQTRTDAEALAFWQTNNKKLVDDKAAHQSLKEAVARHRESLKTAEVQS